MRRARAALVVALVGLVVVVVVVVVTARSGTRDEPGGRQAGPSVVPLDRLAAQPRIVFRNTASGAGFGHVALVARDDPGGPRAVTPQVCDRVAAVAVETLCLRAGSGIAAAYTATVVRDGRVVRTDRRPGIPSRARLSPRGTELATTAFVAGDSYTSASLSTRTFIAPVDPGPARHVEDFELVQGGRRITPTDRNYWGVTFVDEDSFYISVAFGGHTWLARGSVRARRITTLSQEGECPSVSPDHRRLGFKVRQPDGTWRVGVLDLATGERRTLPGDRSVDDQVAWLDADTLLYALPRTGTQSGHSDVWAVAADGTSRPRLLVREAASPTVVE